MAVCVICGGSGFMLHDGLCIECSGTGESEVDCDAIIYEDDEEVILPDDTVEPILLPWHNIERKQFASAR